MGGSEETGSRRKELDQNKKVRRFSRRIKESTGSPLNANGRDAQATRLRQNLQEQELGTRRRRSTKSEMCLHLPGARRRGLGRTKQSYELHRQRYVRKGSTTYGCDWAATGETQSKLREPPTKKIASGRTKSYSN